MLKSDLTIALKECQYTNIKDVHQKAVLKIFEVILLVLGHFFII